MTKVKSDIMRKIICVGDKTFHGGVVLGCVPKSFEL